VAWASDMTNPAKSATKHWRKLWLTKTAAKPRLLMEDWATDGCGDIAEAG